MVISQHPQQEQCMITEQHETHEHEMQEQVNQQETPAAPQEQPTSNRVNLAGRRQSMTADVLKAHVALLEKEVILSRQGDLFRLVQHHYHRLQSWHDAHTGWRIQRSSTVIRLMRHLSAATPGYLYDRLKDPKDFACLTWILWYAESRQLTGHGNEQQFLLSQMAEQMQEQSSQGAEGALDFRRPSDRYSIQRALQYLEDLGGLQLVDGQTREWVEQSANGDALYEFTDVARSLVAALHPHMVEIAAPHLSNPATTLQSTLLPTLAAGTPPLVRAWRALLLGPALFKFDDPIAFSTLLTHTDAIANELLETFGWLLDIHRDYACVVRASGMSSGPVSALTPYGTNDQIAMLLCHAMRQQVENGAWSPPDSNGCLHVTNEDMAALLYTVRERYGDKWGNEARNKSAHSLLNDVYRKMRQVGLLRGPDGSGNILVLPTAARYAASYDKPSQETPVATTRNRTKSSSNRTKRETVAVELPGMKKSRER
jgi:uncharacterized protein (TIGR02678 family)